MATKKLLLIAVLMAASATSMAADSGFYVTGSMGIADTSLDTSDFSNGTGIVNESTNKFGYGFGAGYRFNTYIGAEASYVNFGSPTYNLRQSDGSTSKLTLKNDAYVMAVQGYIPLTRTVTLTGKAGLAFVQADMDRRSSSAASNYHDTDKQIHTTFGFGGLYGLNENLSVKANIDWYPQLSKASDKAADTSAHMISVGLQYGF